MLPRIMSVTYRHLIVLCCAGALLYLLVDRDARSSVLSSMRAAELPPHERDRPFPKRIVHLDLKGAPPRMPFLEQWMREVKRLGGEGVLMEYEDMFPYQGDLRVLAREGHYSQGEVEKMNEVAASLQLELIPLVQTFGHLEFALKHEQFRPLRENRTEDNTICPSAPESWTLITEMIRQVRALHPHSRRIHIGADEAYHVAEDVRCKKVMSDRFRTADRLKLAHISRTASFARALGYSEVFVWNDMFDKCSTKDLKQANLSSLVTPVVWGYATDVTRPGYFPDGLFDRLAEVFPRVWLGTAWKGANGQFQTFAAADRYLTTHQSYVNLYRMFAEQLSGKVEGVFLTGWQRFSHHQPLCELIPIGMPSLALAMAYLDNVNARSSDVNERTRSSLSCPAVGKTGGKLLKVMSGPVLEGDAGGEGTPTSFYPPKDVMFSLCDFPGRDVYVMSEALRFLTWKAGLLRRGVENEGEERRKMKEEVHKMRDQASRLLSAYYYEDTVDEWVRKNVDSLID